MTKLFQLDKSDEDFIVRIHDEEIVFTAEELIKALRLMKAMAFDPQSYFTSLPQRYQYNMIRKALNESYSVENTSIPPSVPLD